MHMRTINPSSGFCNPQKGLEVKYILKMAGKRTPKSSGHLKRVFAENVRELMELRFEHSTNKPMAMAKTVGITLSSVQRVIGGETAPTLDTVEAIAEKLKVEVITLLTEKKATRKKTGTHG